MVDSIPGFKTGESNWPLRKAYWIFVVETKKTGSIVAGFNLVWKLTFAWKFSIHHLLSPFFV